MLNAIWTVMVLGSILAGALSGRLDAVSQALADGAKQAATLAFGLVGVMTLWLGLVRILHAAGALVWVGRGVRPLMRRLFPSVPPEHPAMGMIVLNMVCNIMGLGNAATPFGLRAMAELNRLNPRPGVASDPIVMFLAINTSGMAILPTGMMALRASLGSSSPGSIFVPTLLSTMSATVVGVLAAWGLARLWPMPRAAAAPAAAAEDGAEKEPAPKVEDLLGDLPPRTPSRLRAGLAWAGFAALLAALAVAIGREAAGGEQTFFAILRRDLSHWTLLIMVGGMVLVGLGRGVAVYQAVVEGGREGFQVALRVMPFLVAILTATAMLRASGGLDAAMALLDPVTRRVGMPAEALPMALLRPLSGQGAYGLAADIMQVHGPDSLVGQIVATMMGSTETTFYVLALYLGAVGITRARHAVAACILADVAGLMAAVWTCRWLLA